MYGCTTIAVRRVHLCLTSRTQVKHVCLQLIKSNNISTNPSHDVWTSQRIRNTFIEYFKTRQHTYVPSSSVIAKKGDGSYFVNAGMNQFKPIFLGTVEPASEMASYQRVVNSQKCIRIGGKHNDLDDVGKDMYHHTFFEMLGNWSFGDYFKKEACQMAWDLLTRVYGLPERNLYVTFFGGNEKLGLSADTECRDIWLELGVSKDRILPFGMQDNFWDMGETGPCGPCTEIHFDHLGRADARHLVNASSPEVIELWNLVFMQFDRVDAVSLRHLPCQHVDTGMGLERLTAVLQNTTSNYDTDLFQPLFSAIQQGCECTPYQGRIGVDDVSGVDTAYRIIADHARMFTVALGDGLRPGRKDRDNKLRHIIHRCIQQLTSVMKAPRGVVGGLLPVVVESLGDAFPELQKHVGELKQLVDTAEDKYLQSVTDGKRALKKALSHYGSPQSLDSDQISLLESGHFGAHVPFHMLTDLADDLGIQLHPREAAELHIHTTPAARNIEEPSLLLNVHDMQYLKEHHIPLTDDAFKYTYNNGKAPLTGSIVALKHAGRFVESVEGATLCGVLLDRTCYYAEGGGQVADVGTIQTSTGVLLAVDDVQMAHGYVLHVGRTGRHKISVGDIVSIAVNSVARQACSKNHTATHILSFALNSVLGDVQQAGSNVNADKLTFDFSCLKNEVSSEDILAVSTIVNQLIQSQLPVYSETTPLSSARTIRGLSMLADQTYPADVRVVSIGVPLAELMQDPSGQLGVSCSVELCGGTHVENTAELGALVITGVQGTQQGTKRLVAITGDTALQAVAAGEQLVQQLDKLSEAVQSGTYKEDWLQKAQAIEKSLSGQDLLLPKVSRDKVKITVEMLMARMLSAHKNTSIKESLAEKLTQLLIADPQSTAIVAELTFNRARDIIEAVSKLQPTRPVLLLSRGNVEKADVAQGLVYVPKDLENIFSATAWAEHVCSCKQAKYGPPKAKKFAKITNISLIAFKLQDESDFDATLAKAKTYVNSYV